MIETSLRNIGKVYPGGVQAVKDFSMDIEKGEFIVFVGPSGCGKSTMLRMIAGLEAISSGDLLFNGEQINNTAPADRNFAMVFQNYALFGTMTVYENIGVPLMIRHLSGDDIHEKVMEVAEMVELMPELNRLPRQLSGGQRQRVAIGRSLVRNPEVFLMDEPLSNLDAKLRSQTRKELAELQRQLGTTFIYVTHDQVEAMTLADRIVVMDGGVAQQIGTPIEVYQNPANLFVAQFIGSPPMNFIHGMLENAHFVSENVKFDLPTLRQDALAPYYGREVIAGVRPEHFLLTGDSSEGVTCDIDFVEYLGHKYLIHFTLNNHWYCVEINGSSHGFHVGGQGTFFVDSERVSFFDPDTTVRIGGTK